MFPTIRQAEGSCSSLAPILHICSEILESNIVNLVFEILLSYKATTSVGLSFGAAFGHSRAMIVIWAPEITTSS